MIVFLYSVILLRGLVAGFLIAIPTGPVGVLCMQRTLAHGRKAGLVSGLGSATADFFYACIVIFGLTMIADVLVVHQILIRTTGILLILIAGVRMIIQPVSNQEDHNSKQAFSSAFVLTIANPTLLITLTALFAALRVHGEVGAYAKSGLAALAVLLGSVLWWVVAVSVLDRLRPWLSGERLLWLNRITGALVTVLGLVAILVLH